MANLQLYLLIVHRVRKNKYSISVSGQLSNGFRVSIKSQSLFIAQTSGLHHSIAHCLVSLETEIQFLDALRRKMTRQIVEHAMDELSDSHTFMWMNYRTVHQLTPISPL